MDGVEHVDFTAVLDDLLTFLFGGFFYFLFFVFFLSFLCLFLLGLFLGLLGIFNDGRALSSFAFEFRIRGVESWDFLEHLLSSFVRCVKRSQATTSITLSREVFLLNGVC